MGKQASSKNTAMYSEAAIKLKSNMHKLWSDHITWTRNVVLCIVDGLPGKDQALKRLLKNQDDIGNAIKTYYGNDAGKSLTELLYGHINIAAEVVTAAKANNTSSLNEADKRWHNNADEIAVFLSKANPNWKNEEMKKMMYDHLKALTEQVKARVNKNYDDDVKSFDKGHDQILEMADMLTEGIVKQFPEKFKTEAASSSQLTK